MVAREVTVERTTQMSHDGVEDFSDSRRMFTGDDYGIEACGMFLKRPRSNPFYWVVI
jgi:hypothetical protein